VAAGARPRSAGSGGAESDVIAGTDDLSETGAWQANTAGSWFCVGGSQLGFEHRARALGQSPVCTINNDDQDGHLKLTSRHVDQ